jgi:hypothetical protein
MTKELVAWDIEDCLEQAIGWANTRGAVKRKESEESADRQSAETKDENCATAASEGTEEIDGEELDTIKMAEEYWAVTNPPPNIHIVMDPEFKREFIAGYTKDRGLEPVWNHCDSDPANWVPGRRFFRDESGLLFFSNVDYQPRLCVPENQKWRLLQELHENPMETAHAGPEKLWQQLSH